MADEVAFFVPEAEDVSTGLGSLELCRDVARELMPVFRRCRREGIVPSINIWWTVSFSHFATFPRDQHDQFPFRWAVSVDGKESRVVACPQDVKWRAHVCEMYRIFARLKPARLWIDDDVRATLRADMHCPCLCIACLDEMRQRTGTRRSREELLKAILADPPNPVREAWLAFQRDLIHDIDTGLAQAVHEVSPGTHLGVMFSPPELHFAEGRRWNDYVAALGQPTPYCRPHLGPYTQGLAVQNADGLTHAMFSQATLPEGVVVAPELENYPYSRFAKSVRHTRAQMGFAQLLGLNEITISLFPFSGHQDKLREDVWEKMLGETKPMLQSIADLGITRDQLRGISLYWHEDVCRHVRGVSQAAKPVFLYRQRPFDAALPMLGFSIRYGDGEVTVVTAETICCLSATELERLFSRGVLLDARAVESLILLGRGDLAGAAERLPDAKAVNETIETKAFGGIAGDPMSMRQSSAPWQFQLDPRARVITRYRGYRGEETGHGMWLFENRLGGRVAVLPLDTQNDGVSHFGLVTTNALHSPTFLTWTRQALFHDVLKWLGRKPVPLFVPCAPGIFPVLVDQGKRLVVGVVNLSSDPIERLALQLAAPAFPVRRVRALRNDGEWVSCKAKIGPVRRGCVTIQTGLTVGHFDTAVLTLE